MGDSCSSALHLEAGVGHELLKEGLELGVGLGGELSLSSDGAEDVGSLGSDHLQVELLELGDLRGLDLVQETAHTSVQDAHLLLSWDWHVLLLLEEFGELLTSVEELLGGSVEIGTELGEGSDFSVLGQLELHGTGDLLHGLDLGSGTDTGHRETDVNGWSDTLVEQLSLQEDLAVSDRNHIGWNVGGHITSLGLNDGEGSEGAVSVVLVHLGSTLEQTGVQVEHITWVSLTTWGTSQQQGHLTVGDGLLGQIVVDDEAVHAVVTEVLTNSAAGVRSQELKWGGIRGSGSNHNSVLEAVALSEESDDVGDGGSLLTDGDVDAVEGLNQVAGLVGRLLVEDGVDGDGGLASLSVTNDKFTLTATNWDL